MKQLLVAFFALILSACSVVQPVSPVSLSRSQTVAFESPSGHSFCAGVWIAPKFVLTAQHCTEDLPHDMVTVHDFGGERVQGEVTFRDKDHDLALVHISEPPPHAVAPLAEYSPQVGEGVHVMGHPSGMLWTYTTGIVSGYRENVDMPTDLRDELQEEHFVGPWMQVAAPIWYGNSGGGVFNADNQLVGITSFKLAMPDCGFIVPVQTIRNFVQAHTS